MNSIAAIEEVVNHLMYQNPPKQGGSMNIIAISQANLGKGRRPGYSRNQRQPEEEGDGLTVQVLVFVDTNVLLHYQFFDEVDWAAQLGVPHVTLVFAPIVFSELDRHKWSGSRREKARAKSVLKKIDSLGLSTTPVKLRDSVDAIALDAEPRDALFAQHRLDPQTADDRLLASFVEFREAHHADRVLILSADSGLTIKGRSRRFEIIAPADTLELPQELDDVERELEKTRRELNETKGAAPDLLLTFGGGKTHGKFSVQPVEEFDVATLQRLLDAWRQKHPHVSGMPDEIKTPFGEVISFTALAGLPGYVSAEDAAKHNAAIDAYRAQYEMFLRLWPTAINRDRKSVLRFNLALENTGAAPAEDVEIQLSTKAAGTWLAKPPKLPAIPKVPKPRSMFELPAIHEPYFDHLRHLNLVDAAANEHGPDISDEGREPQVRYTVKRAKHHVPCELPVVYFQFESDEAVGSFTIDVALFAANVRKPKSGSLHVEVTRETPVSPPLPSDVVDDDDDA